MYLISQMWWYLLLAFLLGAAIGYLLWRLCSRPFLESRFELSRKDLVSRLALLEDERNMFTDGGGDGLASARDVETRLKTELAAAKARAASLEGDIAKAKPEAAAQHAAELKKTRDQVAAEWSAKHAAEVKKVREDAAADAARRHADDVARLLKEHNAALTLNRDEIANARVSSAAVAVVAGGAAMTTGVTAAAKSSTSKVAAVDQGDDLKLVWGIGPEIEKLLNQNGITRFEQIAHWTDKDLIWCDGVLPQFSGRALSEKWVEQCRKLSSGFRPEREIGDRPSDILSAPRGGKADDLKLIWGVGPKLEKMLNDAGFYHFNQIAKWSAREIEWVDTRLGDFAGRAVRDKWVEQCKKLATGWRPESDAGDKPA